MIFDLKEVGYTDLEGTFIRVSFGQKDFGNTLYKFSPTIEMEDFARAIHKDGKAEITDEIKADLLELAPKLWTRLGVRALTETFKKIFEEGL